MPPKVHFEIEPPFKSIEDNADMLLEKGKASLRESLCGAYQLFEKRVDVVINYTVSPKVGTVSVVANRKYDKGQLILIPLSNTVGVCLPNKLPKTAGLVRVPSLDNLPVGHMAYISPSIHFAKQGGPKKEAFNPPYWCIPEASDTDVPNMFPGQLKAEVTVSVDAFGKPVKTKVVLPMLYNKGGDIAKGDTLLRPSKGSAASAASPGKRSADAASPSDLKKART